MVFIWWFPTLSQFKLFYQFKSLLQNIYMNVIAYTEQQEKYDLENTSKSTQEK